MFPILMFAAITIQVPEGGISLPMQDIGGRPVVELRLNGKGPYPFILDTGASHTVVNSDLMEELGLANGQWRIQELRLGDAVLRDVSVISAPGLRGLGGDRPLRGVLSAASFPGYLLTLDYPGRKIKLRRGELPAPDERRIFEYDAHEMLPVVPIHLPGRDYNIHVDSGSPGALMLPLHFMDELKLTGKPVEAGRARTVAGEFALMAAGVEDTISLGEYPLDLPRVIFSDLRPGPAPGIGNIGYEVLRHFVVTFDSRNRRLKFEKP